MNNIEKYNIRGCPPNTELRKDNNVVYGFVGECVNAYGDCFVCWVQFVNWLMQESEDEKS